jgi:hypothetical protein
LNELPRLRSFELAHGESLILPNLSETIEEDSLAALSQSDRHDALPRPTISSPPQADSESVMSSSRPMSAGGVVPARPRRVPEGIHGRRTLPFIVCW